MEGEENQKDQYLDDAKKKMQELLSTGIFGNLEAKVCERLVNGVKVISLQEGEHIYTDNQIHGDVHIVLQGALKLCFSDEEETRKGKRKTRNESGTVVRTVKEGENLYSLLNIAAEMTDHRKGPIIHVEATEDSTVIRLPIESIINMAGENTIFTIRLLQMMLVRSSSIMRIIQSIPEIQADVYSKSDIVVESTVGSESEEANYIDVVHDANIWGEYYDFQHHELLWGKDVSQYTDEELRNTHGLNFNCVEVSDEATITNVSESVKKLLLLKETDELQKYISVFEVGVDGEIAERHCQVMDLVYIVSGTVIYVGPESEYEIREDTLHGIVSVLTGEPQRYEIKSGENGCTIALISRKSTFAMIRDNVKVMLHLCHYLLREMSNFFRILDVALGWNFVNAEYSSKGLTSSGMVYVLTGRLRLHKDGKDSDGSVSETCVDYGRGEVIGFEDTLLQRQAKGEVTALRNSQIVKLPTELCRYFMKKYPEPFFQKLSDLANSAIPKYFDVDQFLTCDKFWTVVCIPTSANVPLESFQINLQHALKRYGTDFEIHNKDEILHHVPGDSTDGSDATKSVSHLQIRSYLGNIERDGAIICFSTQWDLGGDWDKLFLQQADLVFVIGEFDNKPSNVDPIKEALQNTEAKKALILLHKPTNGKYKKPVGSTEWINRLGVKRSPHFLHFHMRCPEEMFSNVAATFDPSEPIDSILYDDFGRLARYLLGKSNGLVLGGGGARGLAHVGIIQAMEEQNIPIDVVGGTSMGAFVGASYCSCTDLKQIEDHMKVFCKGMKSWDLFLDATLPILSVSTGSSFDRLVKEPFGESSFDDLWIPYFNIATDITDSRIAVNTTGTLWPFVRASMSLVMLVPPLCSPKDGHYLLDGGSVDNLPADVMHKDHRECETIVAVDVGGRSNMDFFDYGDHISGWWILVNRFLPRRWRKNIPNVKQLISGLTFIVSEEYLKRVMANPAFSYIRPDGINSFDLLDFDKYEEIKQCGYEEGKKYFKTWKNH